MKRAHYWIAEAVLTLLVLIGLFMLGLNLRSPAFSQSMGERYLTDFNSAVAMPDSQPLWAAACALPDATLPEWRNSLCQKVSADSTLAIARVLTEQLARIQSSFAAPLWLDNSNDDIDWQAARAGSLPNRLSQKTDESEAWSAMFSRRYALAKDEAGNWYSPSVSCAVSWLQQPPVNWKAADSALIAAAMLSGRSIKVRQGLRQLPAIPEAFPDEQCATLGSPSAVIIQTAQTMSQANISIENARKAEKMQSLPARAGWTLLLYGSIALLLLNFSRAPKLRLGILTGVGLVLWALAAWVTDVLLPARWPTWSWFALMGVGLAWVLIATKAAKPVPRPMQYPTTRLGLAVFVLLVGLGWLVLLDLSTHAHEKNRYLALYQQGNVLVAFMLVSLLPAWRLKIMGWLASIYARLLLAVDRWQWLKLALAVVLVVVIALVLRNQRQFTSELWRMWLLFGLGYFLSMRGTLLVRGLRDGWRPLLLILIVPVIGFIVTDDNGPLLVTLFGGALLLGGLTAAFLRSEWRWPWKRAFPGGLLVSGGLALLLTLFLFTLGQLHGRTRERLASVFDPFSAANDQMALVHNFRASIPNGGYQFGDVPWCGEMGSRFCAGVPAQIQSDYTLTALQGILGTTGWIFLLLATVLVWWMRLLFNQQRAVIGQPELGGMTPVNAQSWISWMCVSWLVLLLFQLFITVAANMGFFPLTGITLPFISYGSTSLWANSLLLALTLNVLLPKDSAAEPKQIV